MSEKKKQFVNDDEENPFDDDDDDNKPQKQTNDDGDDYWQIGSNRRVTINRYAGKVLVDIREYYEKDGKRLPGKKGITLQKNTW